MTTRTVSADPAILIPNLKSQVFHLTTQHAFELIVQAREVRNNRAGEFGINTGSRTCFSRENGYISFFDFRECSDEDIETVFGYYNFLGPTWFREERDEKNVWELAYLILDEKFYGQILSNVTAREYTKTHDYLNYIPRFEVWIAEAVPIDGIRETLLVKREEPLHPFFVR